jgi:MFS family permease
MTQLARLLIITLFSDLSTVLIARGVPFLGHDKLGFGNFENLLLTLAFGLVYVPAALVSHRLSTRLGERRCLAIAYTIEAAICALAGLLWTHPAILYLCLAVQGLTNGMKWPVLESYVSAGRVGRQQARAIGLFNLAWASSFPVALFGAGPIIEAWPAGILLLPAGISLGLLVMALPLPARPVHLPDGHPDSLGQEQRHRWGRLLTAGRMLNLLSQAGVGVLGALMPAIFTDTLKFQVFWATGLSGLLDLTRFLAFFVLQYYTLWHGRRSPLTAAMIFLAVGFFMVILGNTTGVVLAGEVIFGMGGAVAYYAALYYAMAVENAAVEAGGVHEALIGLGAIIGPISGLAGVMLQPALGGAIWGTLLGMGPMFLLCAGVAGAKLVRMGPRKIAD